jgi:hypothetical protein
MPAMNNATHIAVNKQMLFLIAHPPYDGFYKNDLPLSLFCQVHNTPHGS